MVDDHAIGEHTYTILQHCSKWFFALQVFTNTLFLVGFNFLFLFLLALGLHCCMQAFSSCVQELLFVAVCERLIAVASLVVKHRL